MHRTGRALVGLALAMLVAARAYAADDVDEARKGIAAGNDAFMQAVSKQDPSTLASLYTKDAIVLPPDAEMIVGSKTGIEALWKESLAGGLKAFKLETINVERSGDMAVETGRFSGKIAAEGKPEATVGGKYVVVWKRESDGTWKLHRDIWNADPAPKAAETTASAR
jgi:uncharacterized protein (TIGR02246 family)